jgi:hypothetical protein
MIQILVRFLVGGAVVSVFAMVGDVLKPKSFAGLFGAAPSIALATLGLTISARGTAYAAIESCSMIAGAAALFAYASFVSWIMMRYKIRAFWVTICSLPVWFSAAFAVFYMFVKQL